MVIVLRQITRCMTTCNIVVTSSAQEQLTFATELTSKKASCRNSDQAAKVYKKQLVF